MDHLEHLGVDHKNLKWFPAEEFEVWELWKDRRDLKTQLGLSQHKVKYEHLVHQLQNGTLFQDDIPFHQPRLQLLVAPQILYKEEQRARREFREEMKEGEPPFQRQVDMASGLPFDKETFKKVAKQLGLPKSYCIHFHRKNSVPFLTALGRGFDKGQKGFICQTPFLTNSDFFISLAVSYDPNTQNYRGLLTFVLDHPRYDALRHYIFAAKHLVQHPLLLPIIIFTVADTHNRQQYQHVDRLIRTSFELTHVRHKPDDANLEDFSMSLREASKRLELLQWCQTTITSAMPEFLQTSQQMIAEAFVTQNSSKFNSDVTSELKEFFENIKVGMEYQFPTRERLELQISHVAARLAHEETQINLRQAQYGKQDAAAMGAISVITMVFLPATALATIFSMELFFDSSRDGSSVTISESFWVFLVIAVPLTLFVVCGWAFWTIYLERPRSRIIQYHVQGLKEARPAEFPPDGAGNFLAATPRSSKIFIKNSWQARQKARDMDEESTLLSASASASASGVMTGGGYVAPAMSSDSRRSNSLFRSSSYGTPGPGPGHGPERIDEI